MTDYHQLTIDTYDRTAAEMAKHFQQYAGGVVSKTIGKTFELAGHPAHARVVELGCGSGKDAVEIVKHCSWYEGFDPAAKLLEIAQTNLPGVNFVEADALSYRYPENLDVVFAFASMLHLERADFATVCEKVARALKPGGMFCMTLKEADEYRSQIQQDQYGDRMFYLYNPSTALKLAGAHFERVFESHETVGPKSKPWFTLILRKRDGLIT
jgi:ubiquinone/menaquinone biosynthesis C-methylase UbiE